jgi:predicted ATP-grasp superfamily ATP-dependent carboligase
MIAPELDDILENRCRQMAHKRVPSLNCSADAIALCSDKWKFFEFCERRGWPSIPTALIADIRMPWQPCVVKRRDGAGSFEMQVVRTPLAWQQLASAGNAQRFLAQPWIAGRPISVAAFYAQGSLQHLLPVAEQRISTDEKFQYLGGEIPATIGSYLSAAIADLMTQLGQAIPGLHGYVGADFIAPSESESPLLVEINPRLTTSYVGYRALCTGNVAAWLRDPSHLPGPTFRGSVRFAANGQLLEPLG